MLYSTCAIVDKIVDAVFEKKLHKILYAICIKSFDYKKYMILK